MNKRFFEDLELIKKDEDQFKAYESEVNTVVIAGPGSGKTRVLVLKAMRIISEQPSNNFGIACLSYSRETVREIKSRLRLYGYKSRPQDFVGTVHGFCLGEVIGPFQHLYPEYKIPSPFKIASSKIVGELYRETIKELRLDESVVTKTVVEKARYLSITGRSTFIPELDFPAQEAAELYERKLYNNGCIDFTQIAKISTSMIQEKEYVRRTLEAKYPWFLIDEYQDLGKALHEMVLTLHATTLTKIFVVGDMDQSIYGFQGAYPDFLEEIYNNDDFDMVKLKYNYRSNQDVISASIVALNPPPPEPKYIAKLKGEEKAEFVFIQCKKELVEQYNCVATKVIPKLVDQGIPLNEIVVITGSNTEVLDMAGILQTHNIPSYLVRWSFDHGTDVTVWLVSCAKWCENCASTSFEEIFRFWDKLLRTHESPIYYEDKNKKRVLFHEIISSSIGETRLSQWLDHIIDYFGLIALLEDSDRYPDENANLQSLLKEARGGNLKELQRSRFTKLTHPESEVTVTTRHSAKGLEFEAVILLGMEEGRFPHYTYSNDSREMREAHRLCYVCVSRAKKICVLLYSQTVTIITRKGTRWPKPCSPSRFWIALTERFGNDKNIVNSESY